MTISNADVILAALTVTGPKPEEPNRAALGSEAYAAAVPGYNKAVEEYDQRLKRSAREIKVMLTEESGISKQLIALDKALDKNSGDGKIFTGVVIAVAKEATSKRAVVTLDTGTDRKAVDFNKNPLPLGQEQLRTELMYNADGKAMARAAQLLIGHRVTVYVELESIRGGETKVRVLRHIEDGGVPEQRVTAAA